MNGIKFCQDTYGKEKGPELDLKPYNLTKEKGGGAYLLLGNISGYCEY